MSDAYAFDRRGCEGIEGIRGRQDVMRRIGAIEAWKETLGAPDIPIAVLDTGVYGDHVDLRSVQRRRFAAAGLPTPDPNDGDVHGTRCAGLATTVPDEKGIWGVGAGCSLYSVRIGATTGSGTIAKFGHREIAEGIRWAVDNGARVLNLSWALAEDPGCLADTIAWAVSRCVVVAAVGNRPVLQSPGFPANQPGVIGVAALEQKSESPYYSALGEGVFICAPGENNLTTDFCDGPNGRQPTYSFFDGTSAATPLVAGAAGLVLSACPGMTPEEVRRVLADSARPLKSKGTGCGLLNVAGAVAAAKQRSNGSNSVAGVVRPAGQGFELVREDGSRATIEPLLQPGFVGGRSVGGAVTRFEARSGRRAVVQFAYRQVTLTREILWGANIRD